MSNMSNISNIENIILTCIDVWQHNSKSYFDKFIYWLYKNSSSSKKLILSPSSNWEARDINTAIYHIRQNRYNIDIELQFIGFKTKIHDERLYIPIYKIIINKYW
jgi:hypothetical protein